MRETELKQLLPALLACATALLVACSSEPTPRAEPAPPAATHYATPAWAASAKTQAKSGPGEPRILDASSVTILSRGSEDTHSVSIANGTVYWAAVGGTLPDGVYSCRLTGCGGVGTLVASGHTGAAVATPTEVYWGHFQPKASSLAITEFDGGFTTSIPLSHPILVGGIAVNADYVYSLHGVTHGTLTRCARADGCTSHSLLADDILVPAGIALDASYVYWTAEHIVMRANLDGSSPVTLVSTASEAMGIAVDATNVYYVDYVAGTVNSCAIAGCGGVPTVLASGQPEPLDVAVDAHHAYWINFDGSVLNGHPTGSIARVPLAGGATEKLLLMAAPEAGPGSIALTSELIVWAGGGEIRTLPK